MKKTLTALLLCLALLPRSYAAGSVVTLEDPEGDWIPKASVSVWAKDGVISAYKAGLVSPAFNLGDDYTKNISREQFARLAVEFTAVEKQTTVTELLETYGIQLLEPVLPEPEVPGDSEPVVPETTEPDSTEPAAPDVTEPDSTEPVTPDVTEPETSDTAGQGVTAPEGQDTTDDIATEPDDGSGNTVFPEAELSNVVNGSFTDTQNAYVELAAKMGIVQGANGLFRPAASIQRAEAAAMLQRTLSNLGVTEADAAPQEFSDFYEIPRWAVESVKFVSGRTDGNAQPLMGGANGKFSPVLCYTIEQSILTMLRMHATLSVGGTYASWRDAPGYDVVSLDLTFGGDCTFGRGRDFSYEGSFDEMYNKHKNDLSYFFSGIPEFYDDDLTMVNFEGTLTNSTKYANKTFVFKGPAEYAKILPAGSIDVVTVANNHSMDYLQKGFDDTVRNLSPYVKVSGYSRMPIVTVKGVKIGFASNVGWTYDAEQRKFIDNAITALKNGGADIIVFNYHWGVERSYHSDATQRAIGHYCIDKGADLVIGHHPHVVQEVEVYKEKPIAYSLGNLVFGGNHNPSEKNCLIFRQNFKFNISEGKMESMQHQALKYRVSSVNYRNDYHPIKAK